MLLYPRRLLGMILSIGLHPTFLVAAEPAVPILVYHRFGPVHTDSMTITTGHFKEQIDLLCRNHYSVIPLEKVVAWRLGKGTPPPPRSVVLTFDDGHISVYSEAFRIVTANRIPVTLFIYPSCISRASYAMTWEELSELAATPYFRIESHTFWHPNFKQEAKKLDQSAYTTLVDTQLRHSKAVLEERFRRPVEFLAWPFGVYDRYLMNRAGVAGYQAAFTIECHAATMSDPIMALPRCLVSDQDIGPRFLRLLDSAIRTAKN
ncbi:MAG TPA: polysaccharide deacetylase family protein [Bryobacteraceae bacterium]|jgi:peptidoglycan/xylan/chitin deacetylase (PgdA/CDA1 family)